MPTHKGFTKVKFNGVEIPEGYVTNNWMESRFSRNKNILLAFVGGTGSGKSYSCIRLAELWYKEKFNQEFPQENICFSISEAVKRLRHGNLKKGELLIVEEAGVLINSLNFQDKVAKFFTAVLQSFRSKNIGIIFNLPNISFLNKTARSLLHAVFLTMSIDMRRKQTVIKPFYWQTNAMSGKTYQKYLRQNIGGRKIKVERIRFGLPSESIVKPYEERKDAFVNKTMESLDEVTVEDRKSSALRYAKILWAKIDELKAKGITRQYEWANILGLSQKKMSEVMQKRWEMEINSPKIENIGDKIP